MEIFGQNLSPEDVLRRCNPAILYGARRLEICGGRGRGQRLIEVKTSAGLRATIAEDKCLDILELEYKGVNLGFLSKNGIIATDGACPETDSFVKYWAGGLLATCGLRNTGGSCSIDGEFFPTHGNIGLTPAENIGVSVDAEKIVVTGKIRETSLFGHCLEMERRIVVPSDGARISVSDIISNLTPADETILLLYHINFGFPFLSEDLLLEFPEGNVCGRTELAQKFIENRCKISPPIDNEPELVFFYQFNEKEVNVNLINQKIGIKAVVRYDSSQLPILSQWKCMRSGDYALGIEPGTSLIRGREQELENGYNIKVPGFGSLEYGFTIDLENI